MKRRNWDPMTRAIIAWLGVLEWGLICKNYYDLTEYAAYINRQLHTWCGLGARLDSVDLSRGKSQLLLQFVCSAPTRTGMQEYTVRIPVPKGQEEAAEKILKHFTDAIGGR